MHRFGELTSKGVGILLKEMVRRAIEIIQARQYSFESSNKINPLSGKADIVTSVDLEVQELYFHLITTCLPSAGIIGEEESLRVGEENRFCVTVDPLDGTRAFIRGQSHGVGTMIAFLDNDEIASAYIGDANTREIFGYRPGSRKVHHITQYNVGRTMTVDPTRPLREQNLLTRFDPSHFTPFPKTFFDLNNTLFTGYEIGSGSVGMEFTRLWKREVGAILIRPTTVTPWDFNPVVGISEKLGYRFYALRSNEIEPLIWKGLRNYKKIEDEVLICHESRFDELIKYFKEYKNEKSNNMA